MNAIHSLLGYAFFPLILLCNLGAFFWARSSGQPLDVVLLACGLITLVMTLALERVIPYRRDWNKPRNDLGTDITSFAVLGLIMEPLLKFLGPLLIIGIYQLVNISKPVLFPAQLPFWIQLVLALLLLEFGYYWAHRLHHGNHRLWWLHALHHSSQRLYSLNSARFHPVNYLLNYFIALLPLLLIGTPSEVLYGTVAVAQPILFLQHANLNLHHGVLNRVFATNEVHRWHHSNTAEEGNSNYGRVLMLWDQLFGSFFLPRERHEPSGIGLYQLSTYPADANYFRQVFTWPRCTSKLEGSEHGSDTSGYRCNLTIRRTCCS